MPRRRTPSLILAALALPALGGCFKSYVAVTFAPPAAAERPAEVVATPRFQDVRGKVKVVALRAPAACATEGAVPPSGTGLAARGRAIVETRCATFMGELERSLSARFKVIGWRESAEGEKASGLLLLSSRRAAADVVLVVNDLTPAPVLVSDFRGAAVRLNDASPDGTVLGPKRLSEDGDRFIRDFLADRYRDGALAGVDVRLEVTAFSGETGEPLWSYRRQVTDPLDGALDARVLFRGRGDTWRPVVPRGRRAAGNGANGESPVQVRLRRIALTVANDLTARFTAIP